MSPPSPPDDFPAFLLDAFEEAVEQSATALGVTTATVCRDGRGFCVAYRTPAGHLVCTEPAPNERQALLEFERAVQSNIFHKQ